MSFLIQCPACKSKLKAKSDNVVGKKLPCPKCKHVFVVTAVTPDAAKKAPAAPADSGAADMGLDDLSSGGAFDDVPMQPLADSQPAAARPKPQPARPQITAAAAKGKPAAAKPKKSASAGDKKKLMIIGGAAAGGVVVVALLIFLLINMFSDPSSGTTATGGSGSGTGGAARGGDTAADDNAPKVESEALKGEFKKVIVGIMLRQRPNASEAEANEDFERGLSHQMAEIRVVFPEFLMVSKSREEALLAGQANPEAAEHIQSIRETMQQLNLRNETEFLDFIDQEMKNQPSPLRQEVLRQITAAIWRQSLSSRSFNKQLAEADWKRLEEVEQKVFGSGSLLDAPEKVISPEDQVLQYAISMKEVGLAMHNFHDVHKSFPRADRIIYPRDAPVTLSWRVWILPYVGSQALYDQFHHDEPWDSPHNQALIPKMPSIYKSLPSLPEGKTTLHVMTGPTAPFREERNTKLADILDGTSNTVMCVLGGAETATEWTRPGGIEYDPQAGLAQFGAAPSQKGYPVLLFDGSVQMLPKEVDASVVDRVIRHDDGQPVSPETLAPLQTPGGGMTWETLSEKIRAMKPGATAN